MAAEMQPGSVDRDEQLAARPAPAASGGRRSGGPRRPGPIARTRNYYRETVSELRKVIYPTRTELVTYTIVVLIFVSFVVAATFGMDLGFAKLDLLLFGK